MEDTIQLNFVLKKVILEFFGNLLFILTHFERNDTSFFFTVLIP